MAVRVVMPTFGLTDGEAILVRWLKSVGQMVQVDEPLFEAENEKANLEVPSPETGVLLHIVVAEGEAAALGEVVAWIGQPGESAPVAHQAEPAQEPTPLAQSDQSTDAAPVDDELTGAATWHRASPLARRLAREHGVDLAGIQGSGSGGRIVAADIEQALPRGSTTVPDAPEQAESSRTLLPLTTLRRTTVQRLVASAAVTVPVPLFIAVDMSEAQRLRETTRAEYERRFGAACSYNALIIRACGMALPDYQELNGEWTDGGVQVRSEVNVGLAVAVERGLLVPVIHRADRKGLAAIQAEINQAVADARDNRLSPQQLSDGTFTITNLGNIGIDAFIPVINPPQTAILGVGRVAEQVVVVAGEAVVRPMANLCLVFDHRAIDGAPAAACLARIKQLLENPYLLA